MIAIINGPVMSLLGEREPEKYGRTTLKDLEAHIRASFRDNEFLFFQSDTEGELIRFLIENRSRITGIVINPAGYTTTSVALRDTISALQKITVEVHLTNIYAREPFRHPSIIAPVCAGQIAGLGITGYVLAVHYINEKTHCTERNNV